MNWYKRHKRLQKILTKDFLLKTYKIKQKSIAEISRQVKCAWSIIDKYLKNYRIKGETNKKHQETRTKRIFTKSYLYQEYVIKDRTSNSIAKENHTSHEVVLRYLRKFNIKVRSQKEASIKGATYGKQRWNWQGGISKLPYSIEFNNRLKYKIRTRDNFICQCCGMTEEEHVKKYSQVLHVHHIDYNKKNCKETNLVTVCHLCNNIANGERDYWFAYYTYIINEKLKNILTKL